MVDDSKLELARASGMLSGAYEVETFLDGPSMLERLGNTAPPEAVLLDGQMPGLSGLDLIRFLREQYDEVTLPILLFTASDAPDDLGEALAAGANDYLKKPCNEAELRARLRTLVRCHRQAKEISGQMRASNERELWLRTTLSSIGEGVIATDVDGRVSFMNAVAESLTGVSQADALAKPFTEVCRIVSGVLAAPGAAPSSVIARHDGSSVAIEVVTAPIGHDANLAGMVYVLRDITERRRFDDARRARSDFEEKLIGIVSHDLRNPLNAILLGTTLLLSDEGRDPSTKKSLSRIQRGAERATRLVSDVLDFTQARLGSGIPMQRETTNAHEIAAQVADEVLAGHPRREVVLEPSGEGDVSWDAQRIAQVLANLLGNALKYGATATPVTLRTRDEGAAGVVVEVHNLGEPIAAETMATMFEPMKRGAADLSARSIGLGLYIVKHIIDAHGGVIEVTSTGAGTTFTIRLPRGA